MLLAPFLPYVTEEIYQRLYTDAPWQRSLDREVDQIWTWDGPEVHVSVFARGNAVATSRARCNAFFLWPSGALRRLFQERPGGAGLLG